MCQCLLIGSVPEVSDVAHINSSPETTGPISFNHGKKHPSIKGTCVELFFSQKQDDDFNSFLFSLGLCTGIIKNFLKSVYGWKMFPR